MSSELVDVENNTGWPTVALGELADIRSGVTLGRRLSGPTIRVPYLRVANVQDGRLDLRVVKEIDVRADELEKWCLQPGDILLTEGGDWDKLGRGTIWRGEIPNCIHQNHIFRVRVEPLEFDPRFLAALIGSPYGKSYFQAASKQTTNLASINQSQLKEFRVLCPPLSEQRRIVARIEELAARIEKARRLRRQAVEELGNVLASAMNQVWSDASDWDRKALDKLVTLVSGQIDPRIEPYASLPHINGEAIESGTCRLLPYRSAKEDAVTSGKYHFRAGSVLYSKIRPYLRKAVQVPVEGICSADVYAFDSISHSLEPRFLMYSLVTQDFTEHANSLSNRARIPKLNQEQLLAYELPCPPLSEQRRVAAYLDGLQAKADALKRLQAESAAELDALLPAVLERAFRGELH